MSRSALVREFFGEGDFDFALKIGECVQLEENRSRALAALGFSPGEASLERILDRLGGGQLLVSELKEVLRLGLVGAGMEKAQAHALVNRHVVPGALKSCGQLAFAVLAAALIGVPEDLPEAKPGESEGGAAGQTRPASPTADGAGATPTATSPLSASTPETSTE